MVEPYKMVLINIIVSFLLGSGLLFYKFFYPKKNINFFILLILLALLPLISLLRPGTYASGDLTQNVFKSMAFFSSLTEGNLLPRWAGELNATYGYPLFIFVYPLPFYLVSMFHFIGLSFIASLKILIASMFLLSGVGMYFWVKEELGKEPAFVAAIFYLYAPYHLVDTHFRISIGEIVSFALCPFILLFIKKVLEQQKLRWFLLLVLFLFFLLLSNQAIALIAFFFMAIYTIFSLQRKKTKKNSLLNCSIAFIFGLGLSAFYWVPVVFESQYTHQALYVKDISFVQLRELFYSPWRYGLLFQGPKGELSFLIGYIQIIVIILAFYFLLKRKFNHSEKSKVLFYILCLLIVCLCMLSITKPIWDTVPILKNFQFTYRLLLFISLITAFLAGLIATKINKKILIIFCVAAILQTILNWGNRKTLPEINDITLKKEIALSTSQGEGFQPAAPKWVNHNNPWQKKIPLQHIDILEGKAEIKELKRTSTKHEYIIYVYSPTVFKENTVFFPGWIVYANNRVIPINFTNNKYPGIIMFNLNKGLYKVNVRFEDTNIRIFSKYISALGFSLLVIYIIFYKKLKKKIRKILI